MLSGPSLTTDPVDRRMIAPKRGLTPVLQPAEVDKGKRIVVAWAQQGLMPSPSRNGAEIESVLVAELTAAFNPRLGITDRQHVAALAECSDRLPSILVH